MRTLSRILFAFLATVFFSAAQAQSQWCHVNPWLDGCEVAQTYYEFDILFHIETDGTIRNLTTGQTLSAQDAINSIPVIGPIGGAIIIGAAGGAAVAIGDRQALTGVLIAAFFGGAAGYYGALAFTAGWVTFAIYGPAAVGATYVGSRIKVPAPVGNQCLTVTDSQNCLIQPY